MAIITGFSTDKGIVKDINQDALLVKTAYSSIGEIAFIAVCDGMGGLEKGELASSTMIRELGRWFGHILPTVLQKPDPSGDIFRSIGELTQQVNQRLMAYGREYRIKLGTTMTAMLSVGSRYYVAHVGDTRLYELTKEAVQITKDQTLVAMEVEMNKLTPEQAKADPRRNLLIQCIGASPKLTPDFVMGELKRDATYLICCDGFRHKVSDEEIKDAFAYHPRTQERLTGECRRLVQLNKQRMERDNITVVALQRIGETEC